MPAADGCGDRRLPLAGGDHPHRRASRRRLCLPRDRQGAGGPHASGKDPQADSAPARIRGARARGCGGADRLRAAAPLRLPADRPRRPGHGVDAMTAAGLLLASALLVPLLFAACCLSTWFRARATAVLLIAPLPALLAALFVPEGRFAFFPTPFRLTLVLDQPGAILLGGAALLWSAAGAYAASLMGRDPGAPRFAIWWLLTLAGSLGLFIVGDVVNFY